MSNLYISKFKNDSAFLEILGDQDDQNDYFVEFIDSDTNDVEYCETIKINYWAQLDSIGQKNILIKVTLNQEVVFERRRDHKFNKVYVRLGASMLGDTVAWIAVVDKFREVHNVEVVVNTSYNNLFDKAYPNLIFSDISNPDYINEVDNKFRIDYGPELYNVNGKLSPEIWFDTNKKYDNFIEDYSNFNYKIYSLQRIATLTMGLPDEEIVPKINIPEDNGPKIKGKYVVVAIQSTAQLKYWNNPFGWERLFDFLGRNGYKVVIIDKYRNFGVPGNYNQAPKSKYVIDKTGNFPLSERITDIKYADMMITISSGLAWVSWAVGTPVVLISGFTKPWYEFQSNVVRVHNPNVCNGCWNDPTGTFDAFDWNYCPKKQDFICSKAILPKDVTDAVKKFMK